MLNRARLPQPLGEPADRTSHGLIGSEDFDLDNYTVRIFGRVHIDFDFGRTSVIALSQILTFRISPLGGLIVASMIAGHLRHERSATFCIVS